MDHSKKETQDEILDNYFYIFRGWSKHLKIAIAIVTLAVFMAASFYAGMIVGKKIIAKDPYVVYNNDNYATKSDVLTENDSSVVSSNQNISSDESQPLFLPKPNSESSDITSTVSKDDPVSSLVTSGQYTAYVNKNTKTFHLSSDCHHLKRMKEVNKLEFHYNSVQEIIDFGFNPCSTCAKEYKQ